MAAKGDFILKLDPSRVATVVGGQSREAAFKAAVATQQRVQQNIRAKGRVKTGKMISGIVVNPVPGQALYPTFEVRSTAKHTIFQERGTRGVPKRPGQVLRFQPKGGGAFVFARSTGPVSPAWFMRDAYRAVSVRDFTA